MPLQILTPAATSNLTTVDNLRAALGNPALTDADVAELAQIVERASDAATRFCGRTTFGREVLRQTERIMASREVLILDRDLVPAITSITVDGTALAAADYELDGALLYRLDSQGYMTCWQPSIVVINYAAGFTPMGDVPRDIEAAVLEIGRAMFGDRQRNPNVRSESVDGVAAVSYLDPRAEAGGLPPNAAALLMPYRVVRV